MTPTLLLALPGGSEWILIVLIVLLIFGGKKIPELMKGIGKGIREFKDAKEDMNNDTKEDIQQNDGMKKATALQS